jgi:hypothetical protein
MNAMLFPHPQHISILYIPQLTSTRVLHEAATWRHIRACIQECYTSPCTYGLGTEHTLALHLPLRYHAHIGQAINTIIPSKKSIHKINTQPEDRIGLLPVGPSRLELDPKVMIENKLVQTQADIRHAQEAMLRESLGPSRLEMPPDQDPHYMTPTMFKAAHAMDAATTMPRPPATSLTEKTQTTATALIGLQAEARERISKVQERLKHKLIKNVEEHLDVPALLLRKFNFLKNPRWV